MRFISILSLLLCFYSCGKTPERQVYEAIDLAQSYLTVDKCQQAIDLLEKVKRQNKDPVYVEVLASAYACRAGYREVNFIRDDLEAGINAASFQTLMTSLAKFTHSYESVADAPNYVDMNTALGVLLYADGAPQPGHVSRVTKYGPRKAGDMAMQALLMQMFNLGKFLNFYGNVNAAGSKGLGPASTDEQGALASVCFLKYNYASAVSYIQTGPPYPGGICNNLAVNDGHPNLLLTGPSLPNTKRRLCEGLMLVTNLIDILENFTPPSNSAFSNIGNIKGLVTGFRDAAKTFDPALSTLLATTSQATCETLLNTPAQLNNMQLIYALIFEKGLQ